MSCDCNTPFGENTTYGSICRPDIPYPSVSHESVPSLIDNLVNALYGQINKNVVGGKVVWNIPCDPNNTAIVSPALPRLAGEGLLCYIMRVFQDFLSGNTNYGSLTGGDITSSGSITCNTLTGNSGPSTVVSTGSTTARTLADRFTDVINVKDFGAVGNGVTDDTAALQAALDYARNKKGAQVRIGDGMRCLVDSANLYINANTTLEGPISRGGTATSNTDYGNVGGAIILNPAYTIMVGDLRSQGYAGRGGVRNLYIINKNIAVTRPSPFNYDAAMALVNSYDGVGVTIGDHRFFCNAAPSTGAVTAIWAFNGTSNVNILSTTITGTGNNVTFLNAIASNINAGTGSHGFTASTSNQFITIQRNGKNGFEAPTFVTSGTGVGFGVFLVDDSYVGYCHIVGFNYAIHANGAGRYEIEKITGDNNNGIYHNNVHDVGRMENCHFWNFVTNGAVSTGAVTYTEADTFRRKGSAYVFDCGGDDWSEAVNCFSFGYDVGFYVAAGAVRLIGCQTDANGGDIPTGTKGFYVTSVNGVNGSGSDNHLIGCQAASHENNYYITSISYSTLLSCSGWATPINQVFLDNGYVKVINCQFFDGASNAIITTGANLKSALISGNSLNSTSPAYNLDTASKYNVNIIPNNIYVGSTGLTEYTAQRITSQASGNGDCIYAIGGSGYHQKYYCANGSPSAPSSVTQTLTLGANLYGAFDGTSFIERAAYYRAQVLGTVSTGVVPSGFIWSTTNDSGVNGDRLVLDQNGNLLVTANNSYNLGNSANGWKSMYVSYGASSGQTVQWTSGTGSPNGVVTANVGSLYTDNAGSTSTTLYVKTSGTGNTGWTAK